VMEKPSALGFLGFMPEPPRSLDGGCSPVRLLVLSLAGGGREPARTICPMFC
jgi:hypothetical protein